MCFFLMSQGSFSQASPKMRFLGQNVCFVARGRTDRQTDTNVKTGDTLSGFQDFSPTYHQVAVQNKLEYDSLFDLGLLVF